MTLFQRIVSLVLYGGHFAKQYQVLMSQCVLQLLGNLYSANLIGCNSQVDDYYKLYVHLVCV